jgi:hypothetical protein
MGWSGRLQGTSLTPYVCLSLAPVALSHPIKGGATRRDTKGPSHVRRKCDATRQCDGSNPSPRKMTTIFRPPGRLGR